MMRKGILILLLALLLVGFTQPRHETNQPAPGSVGTDQIQDNAVTAAKFLYDVGDTVAFLNQLLVSYRGDSAGYCTSATYNPAANLSVIASSKPGADPRYGISLKNDTTYGWEPARLLNVNYEDLDYGNATRPTTFRCYHHLVAGGTGAWISTGDTDSTTTLQVVSTGNVVNGLVVQSEGDNTVTCHIADFKQNGNNLALWVDSYAGNMNSFFDGGTVTFTDSTPCMFSGDVTINGLFKVTNAQYRGRATLAAAGDSVLIPSTAAGAVTNTMYFMQVYEIAAAACTTAAGHDSLCKVPEGDLVVVKTWTGKSFKVMSTADEDEDVKFFWWIVKQ